MTPHKRIRTANAAGKYFWFVGFTDLPEGIVLFKSVSPLMGHTAEVEYYAFDNYLTFKSVQQIHLMYLQDIDQDAAKAMLTLRGYLDEDGNDTRRVSLNIKGHTLTYCIKDELS